MSLRYPRLFQNKERLKRGSSTPIKYKVLKITQLSKEVKLKIASKLVTLNTGDDAIELRGKDGWGYRHLDTLGRVGVLSHRGVEVAVFVKRECSETELEDCDPVPEGEIKDPQDVWVRIDLTGLSARQINARIRKEMVDNISTVNLSETQLRAKEVIINAQDIKIKKYEQQIQALEDEANKKRHDPGKHREMGQRDVMENLLELLAALQAGADNPLTKEAKLLKMLDSMGKKVITTHNAQPIAPHSGDDFDPRYHEAIAGDPHFTEGKISVVGAIGMMMHGQLIKPARVIVGSKVEDPVK